jgi:ribonuclease P protein component
VLHYLLPASDDTTDQARAARVGFVVSRAVGGSVVRHRVLRQLRHLVRDRLQLLPPGANLVIRVKPDAAGRGAAALGHDLDAVFDRLTGPVPSGSVPSGSHRPRP